MKNVYDVFIAYHGSYDPDGSRQYADKLYDYLHDNGVRCFYFPRSSKDSFKSNIIDVMKSRLFILVCTSKIKTDENGRINHREHYELSTEIDAFYAMTQMGDRTVQNSKIIVCGECKRGAETRIHELFASRTHFYMDYEDDVFSKTLEWIHQEQERNHSWQDDQTTNEIKDVFAVRASMKESIKLDALVAGARNVRAVGISNTEMTARINPQAIQNCIEKGGSIELLFLDPDGEYNDLREKEEELRKGKIRNITVVNIDTALDMKDSLGDLKDHMTIMKYDRQPRLNMIFVDDYLFLQYYANNVPGLKNPSFFIEKQKVSPIYDFCEHIYEYLKKDAEVIE